MSARSQRAPPARGCAGSPEIDIRYVCSVHYTNTEITATHVAIQYAMLARSTRTRHSTTRHCRASWLGPRLRRSREAAPSSVTRATRLIRAILLALLALALTVLRHFHILALALCPLALVALISLPQLRRDGTAARSSFGAVPDRPFGRLSVARGFVPQH